MIFQYIYGILLSVEKIDIVYEDDICLVINKASGLAVQGGQGIGTSLDSILSVSRSPRPLLVHRLDRDTSGLILVAKNKQAAADFSVLFGNNSGKNRIIKRYIAICKGQPAEKKGSIFLDIDIRGSKKKSETIYRVLSVSHESEYSMLELELKTGRMHQIRRHLSKTGTPVLGDDKYGDFALNRKLKKTINLRHLLLHASYLFIPKMPNGKSLEINAPFPEYFNIMEIKK